MDREPEFGGPAFVDGDDLAFLRLLQLTDSALPIGSLAHSFGLETLVEAELLTPALLPGFLRGYLEETGTLDAVFCREAFRLAMCDGEEAGSPTNSSSLECSPCARWLSLNDRLGALKPGRESRAGNAALGQNLMNAVLAVVDSASLREAFAASREVRSAIYHPNAFGLIAGVLGVSQDAAIMAFLHQTTASLVSACQRLLPIGQSAATRILWDLKPAMLAAAGRSRECDIDDVTCFMPLLDWGAMEHPGVITRLFIS